MTGFTDIIDIRKAMREVSVEGCEIIGKGGHGTVYRIDGDTIVKLYNEDEPFDEIEREISYAKQFAGADTIVIAAPFWDLSFPAILKTYIENIYVTGIVSRYSKKDASCYYKL